MATKNIKNGNVVVEWVKNHRVLTAIIVLLVLIGGISAAAGGGNKGNEDQNKNTQSSEQQASSLSISQEKAEEYCQDAALLGKYIDLNNYSIISMTSYNIQYGAFGGWYDSDGEDILYLRWNGKNKLTDELAHFDCWISGTDENIHLHKLAVDDLTLQDSTASTVVDSDGTHVFNTDETQ